VKQTEKNKIMPAQQLSQKLENAIAVHKANVQAWSALSAANQPFDDAVRTAMNRTFSDEVEKIFSQQYHR
jgi:hypothetical protein